MITENINIELETRVKELSKLIGNTPIFRINKLFVKEGVEIYAKQEWQQLGGSVKARPAFNIISEAIKNGDLFPGRHLLDASSGNTAIAYAAIGAALGIPVTICLPENASEERKTTLRAYGVNIIFTSKFGGTDEAQDRARELYSINPDKYFYADQYSNENNWKAHYNNTALEIYRQTEGAVTHFVTGLGTTGSFTGTSRRLKELNPSIKAISLQPDAALHGLEGWKHLETNVVPGIYDHTLADENLDIDTYVAYELIKKAANDEGLLLSPSSAANLVGAIKVAQNIKEGVVVTLLPDNGEKYWEVLNLIF
jgi:S-sulfo-L-cysteine synthase (O-acetyl-L-serine-dependent)